MRIKALALAFILILSSMALPAVTKPSFTGAYLHVKDPLVVTNPRIQGMGGAGIALRNNADALYINPAGLSSRITQLSLPYFAFTAYNMYNAYDDGVFDEIIDNGVEKSLDEIVEFIDDLGTYNKLARLDAGFSVNFKGFGIGLAIQNTVHTYSPGNLIASQIVNQLNIQLTIGYGRSFPIAEHVALDLGVSVSLNYLAFNESVSADEAANNYKDLADYFFSGMPVYAGTALPITCGLNLELPYNFSVGATLSNINGKYYMSKYDSAEDVLDNVVKSADFTFSTDMAFNAGVAWSYDRMASVFRPVVACDIVNVVGLANEGLTWDNFLGHLRLGAEVGLFSVLKLRGGLSEGYWSVGAGLDLKIMKIDLAYFNEEYGSSHGEKGVDGFSVRIKLGLN